LEARRQSGAGRRRSAIVGSLPLGDCARPVGGPFRDDKIAPLALNLVCVEDLDLVEPADRDVGEGAAGVSGEIDVVGDRSGIDPLERLERRLCIEDLGLADVLEGEPYLAAVRRRGDDATRRSVRVRPEADTRLEFSEQRWPPS
jgi:hypothetical protein